MQPEQTPDRRVLEVLASLDLDDLREPPQRRALPPAEAWMRLAGSAEDFNSRAQFFFAASESMRRILVEYARRRLAAKRGGGMQAVTLSGLEVAAGGGEVDVLAVDEALQRLKLERPRLAQLVTLRFFAGLSIFAALGILFWVFAFPQSGASDLLLTIALACILGGILGNLYDRLGMWHPPGMPGQWRNEVRDWILLRYGRFTWPNFNIADCMLVCGAGLLMWHAYWQPVEESPDKADPST